VITWHSGLTPQDEVAIAKGKHAASNPKIVATSL
jgi:hypothetical protein